MTDGGTRLSGSPAARLLAPNSIMDKDLLPLKSRKCLNRELIGCILGLKAWQQAPAAVNSRVSRSRPVG